MDRNHYRKLYGKQGVVERYWHAATHIIPQGKAVMDKPRAHYVKLPSGGHTQGGSERPYATTTIDPKGNGRMRGTGADHSVHHPRVVLSSGTRNRNAATEPKGCKA